MDFKYFHLGLRQVVMVLMNWAIDVPRELLQSDAISRTLYYFIIHSWHFQIIFFILFNLK
jgi:hypothetical protein